MKKLWIILVAVALIAGAVMLIPHNVDAATEGVLTYEIANGKATITGCDQSVSGELVIPSTLGGYPVTSIGVYAFGGCRSMTSVVIPDSVMSIGAGTFAYCGIESIEIPGSVTSIGYRAFDGCSSLTSVEIPDSVTSIGGRAFGGCSSLTSVEIPDSVTSIGGEAFFDCRSLTSVVIPASVTSIGASAFEYCSSLSCVYITDVASWCNIDFENYASNPSLYANNHYLNNELVTVLKIPDSVTSIGDWTFAGFSSLTSVDIPDSVTSIGEWAFGQCSSLTNVEIPASVTSIGGSAFYNCDSLTSIEIPVGVTSISNYAFEYCSSLKEINVAINNTAYCSDNGILFNKSETELICYPAGKIETSYEIPEGVTSIGEWAFGQCSSLTSIVIPNSVTSISNYAFYNCNSLTSIEIPNSVTNIGGYAFYDCNSLMTVYYTGTEEDWNKISIDSGNTSLLNAEVVFVQKSELEKTLEGTGLTVGKLANETEVVIVPTVVGNVAMTESELAEMLGDDIKIVSNNGIIGTGSKIIVGEQEVEIAIKGDIDGDGVATVYDALMVKKALANNGFTENDIREFAGDIDGAGVTDSADVDAILAHIVGEMLIA